MLHSFAVFQRYYINVQHRVFDIKLCVFGCLGQAGLAGTKFTGAGTVALFVITFLYHGGLLPLHLSPWLWRALMVPSWAAMQFSMHAYMLKYGCSRTNSTGVLFPICRK